MKNNGVVTVALCGLTFCASAFSCPMFVEFFPDPKNVSDQEGEYVEIRLDDFRAESLFVRLENKEILAFGWPEAERLVLVHDSAQCPRSSLRDSSRQYVACGSLGKTSLPNSRSSTWKVWAGSCMDSVVVPQPKSGKSVQRVGMTDEWAFVEGSFAAADPEYEIGIEDCALERLSAEFVEGSWKASAYISGCDSTVVHVRTLDVWGNRGWQEADAFVRGRLSLFTEDAPGTAGEALWFHAELPEDAAPMNNVIDTLLLARAVDELHGKRFSPLRMTEIHHCPEEPMPEWVEIYNASGYPLPLDAFRFCDRGSALSKPGDSIQPFQTVLVSKDTAALRAMLGIPDIRMVHVSLGFLNNVEGMLRLCFRNDVIDSVYWNKGTVSCPSGFNPLTGRRDYTPGFQSKNLRKEMQPDLAKNVFEYKLSSRVVSKKGAPLRVRVDSEHDVTLSLLDSVGHRVWKTVVSAMSNEWEKVPVLEYLGIGVCFVAFSVGEYEDVVGILVRP